MHAKFLPVQNANLSIYRTRLNSLISTYLLAFSITTLFPPTTFNIKARISSTKKNAKIDIQKRSQNSGEFLVGTEQ